MISDTFNLTEFVEAVKEKDYFEIITLAQEEVRIAEARYREKGSMIYAGSLKGLLFVLKYGNKPLGAGIYAFRPILENLVQRGQMKPEILELFK